MIYLVTGNQSLFNNENTDYTVISVEQSLSLLEPLPIIGVDTETEGIDVHTKKLLLAQFGCFDFQIVVDCRTIDITHYKNLLERKDKLFLFWNAKFDLKFFLKYGIIVRNIYDGYLAEKLQWNGYPVGLHSMSLKSAGEKYCNIELDKSVRGKIIWSKTLTTDIIVYGAQDVQYLEKIRSEQLKLLKEKDLVTALAYENKFCPVLAYFEFCGVKLDENKWKAKMQRDQEKFNAALNNLNQWVVDYYKDNNGTDCTWIEKEFVFKTEENKQIKEFTPKGDWMLVSPIKRVQKEDTSNTTFYEYQWIAKIRQKFPFVYINPQGDLWEGFSLEPKCIINWSSPKQVAPFLELLGFNLETYDKKTKEKKKSVGADIIKSQLEVSTIAPIYIEYKEWEKVVGTYGQNVLDQINPQTGRIHTNFSQCGTDTLRLSSGGKDKENNVEYLNFQNFPANAETRECFIAEPGNKWISADYSGQELTEVTINKSLYKKKLKKNLLYLYIILKYNVMSKSYTNEVKDKIVELYLNEHKNTAEIAKMFNTYNTTIRRILIERKVPLISIRERLQKVTLSSIKNQEGSSDFDYFLGILATDGCVTGNRVVLDFSENNKEILDYWNTFLGNACSIRCSIHKKYQVPQYRIDFRNQEICDYLASFGITPRKSLTLKLKYINWDVLRGIIDGDGCVREQNHGRTVSIEITSGSKIFLEQIQQFLQDNNIKSYLNDRSTYSKKNNYVLSVYKSSDILKIYDCLYQNAHFYLKRKKLKFGSLLKKFNRQ